jgi:hypothetical protein
MPDLFPPTLDELIACADREVRYREKVYPRMIANGRMTQRRADREITLMREIAAELRNMLGRAAEPSRRAG